MPREFDSEFNAYNPPRKNLDKNMQIRYTDPVKEVS